MKHFLHHATVMLSVMILWGCHHMPAITNDADLDLSGQLKAYDWHLVAVKGAKRDVKNALLNASDPPGFGFDRGRIVLLNTCNNYSTNYELMGNALSVEPWVSTRMACYGDREIIDNTMTNAVVGTYQLNSQSKPPTLKVSTKTGAVFTYQGSNKQ